MSEKQKYKSDPLAAAHETMDVLHQVSAIDKKTMRRFDKACLEPSQNKGG